MTNPMMSNGTWNLSIRNILLSLATGAITLETGISSLEI
jgi:hypothetical protein